MRLHGEVFASRQKHEKGRLRRLVMCMTLFVAGLVVAYPVQDFGQVVQGSSEGDRSPIRLSLDEALGMFLKNNFQLLVAKYGIQAAKA